MAAGGQQRRRKALSNLLVLLIDRRRGRRGWGGEASFLSSHRNRASPSCPSSSSMLRPRCHAPGLAAPCAHKWALGGSDSDGRCHGGGRRRRRRGNRACVPDNGEVTTVRLRPSPCNIALFPHSSPSGAVHARGGTRRWRQRPTTLWRRAAAAAEGGAGELVGGGGGGWVDGESAAALEEAEQRRHISIDRNLVPNTLSQPLLLLRIGTGKWE